MKAYLCYLGMLIGVIICTLSALFLKSNFLYGYIFGGIIIVLSLILIPTDERDLNDPIEDKIGVEVD